MLGAQLATGYSSHASPDGREWVFFNTAQILPVAVIHFGQQRAAYPRVLAPLVLDASGPLADDSDFALAGRSRAAHLAAMAQRRRAGMGYGVPGQVRRAVAAKLPTPHVSNRERKAINRAQKGRAQQTHRR